MYTNKIQFNSSLSLILTCNHFRFFILVSHPILTYHLSILLYQIQDLASDGLGIGLNLPLFIQSKLPKLKSSNSLLGFIYFI